MQHAWQQVCMPLEWLSEIDMAALHAEMKKQAAEADVTQAAAAPLCADCRGDSRGFT